MLEQRELFGGHTFTSRNAHVIARDATWACELGRVPEWVNSFLATSLVDLISYVKGKKLDEVLMEKYSKER